MKARMIAAAALLGAWAGTAHADDLYTATTVVTGQMEENRWPGMAICLQDVLVRVSGDPRLIDDPATTALRSNAAALVGTFHYRERMAGTPYHDEQGTRERPFDLTVSFQPVKIDGVLRSLGREPWTAPRPRVVVFLDVQNGDIRYTLASDGDRCLGQRQAFAAASGRYALPIEIPSAAVLAAAGFDYATLASADPRSLYQAAKASGGDVALLGTLTWSDKALGWIADWRMASSDQTVHWQISGVNFDEAFRNAVRGAAQVLSGNGQPESLSAP